MGFSRVEQETIISFNAAEDMAELYTADPAMIRKMNRLVEENPEQFRSKVHSRYQGNVYAMNYYFPKRFVTIRSKNKVSNMTEEQKEQARKRMQNYNTLKREVNN